MEQHLHWEPQRLDQFIGQEALVRQLRIEIQASIEQQRPIRNQLWCGPPGLGKTVLARVLAAERGSPLIESMGKGLTHRAISEVLCGMCSPGYDRQGYLVEPREAVFPIWVIDECQKTSREVLNLMHPAMTPGPDGRRLFMARSMNDDVLQCWCIHHTLIFITNFAGEFISLSPATASRLPIQHRFEWYRDTDVVEMIDQYRTNSKLKIDDDAALLIAQRSNGFPRMALDHLLPRAMDYALVKGNGVVTLQVVEDLLELIGIDGNGLDRPMSDYLKALAKTPGGTMSIRSLAGVLDSDIATLTRCVEPVLMRKHLITLTSVGRQITPAGRAILGDHLAPDPFHARAILT